MEVVKHKTSRNRDPAVFTDAHSFHMERREAKHLAFSYGIHYCIGAAMAKMEIAVVLDMLLDRFPRITRAAPGQRVQNTTIRGFSHLPIRFG